MPRGVTVHSARMPLKDTTVESLQTMIGGVEDAAKLLADVAPHVIAFACTSGSFFRGKSGNDELIRRIQRFAKVPVSTTSLAMIEALRALKVKKVALATPYIDEINLREKRFLEAHGFRVVSVKGLQLTAPARPNEPSEIENQDPSAVYELALSANRKEADGVFISCAGLRALEVAEILEEDLSKPVATSNMSLIWHTLRRCLHIMDSIEGYGRLLREIP
jgi:maleate isomerase